MKPSITNYNQLYPSCNQVWPSSTNDYLVLRSFTDSSHRKMAPEIVRPSPATERRHHRTNFFFEKQKKRKENRHERCNKTQRKQSEASAMTAAAINRSDRRNRPKKTHTHTPKNLKKRSSWLPDGGHKNWSPPLFRSFFVRFFSSVQIDSIFVTCPTQKEIARVSPSLTVVRLDALFAKKKTQKKKCFHLNCLMELFAVLRFWPQNPKPQLNRSGWLIWLMRT